MIKLNTIGRRLFLAFGILFLNIVLISFLGIFFIRTNKKLDAIPQHAEALRTNIIQLFKSDLDFLRFAPIDKNFYKNGATVNWGTPDHFHHYQTRDSVFLRLRNASQSLFTELAKEKMMISDHEGKINSLLNQYNKTFLAITKKLTQRGFKDFGLEGTMRNYAHQLETNSSISLDKILTLRRHEKDFFLRKEKVYIENLHALVIEIVKGLPPTKNQPAITLKKYQEAFNQLTLLEQQIGLSPNEGLIGDLNSFTLQLEKELGDIATFSEIKAEQVEQESFTMVVLIGVLSILISSIATYFTARKLTRPIKNLSSAMSQFVINNENLSTEINKYNLTEEIETLYDSFNSLRTELKKQFEEINQKSLLLSNQNQELKMLNEDLDRFIYSAAHDLKSPLTSLLGLINIAEVDLATAGKQHYFKMMKSSVVKLESFIKDITDYARNKRQNLNIEKIALEDTIDTILSDLNFLPNFERINQYVEVKGDVFYSDKTRIEIVLKNLLSNAIRYADPSKENCFLYIKTVVTNNYLSLVMEDNGIGIGKEHLPKIFDMFYRASEDSKGTGLGLFLVRESVKMLRGNISVNSRLGEGTVFRLKLPNLHKYNNEMPESNPFELNLELEKIH